MSLLWIEGFETFGTTNGNDMTGLRQKYTTDGVFGNLLVQDGRVGGKSCQWTNAARTLTTPNFGNKQTLVVGFGFKAATYSGNVEVLRFLESTATSGVHVTLQVTSTGEWELRRGTGSGSTIATTSGAAISTGTWGYVELKMKIGNAGVGSYELRVNGINVLSDADEDTQNSGAAYTQQVMFRGGGSSTAFQLDDIYILDTSGSLNNDFLGSQKVVALYPNGAGDSTQFTPSTGNNYAAVDENPANDDTDYVESGTSGHLDLYSFDNPSLVNVKGVQINARLRESDGTPFSAYLVAKSGSTQSDGSSIAIGSATYLTKTRVLETNPDTSAAWTDSELDSAQFGVKVV